MTLQVTNISLNNRVQAVEDRLDDVVARLDVGNSAQALETTLSAQRADIGTIRTDTALIKLDIDEIRIDAELNKVAVQSLDTSQVQDGAAVSRRSLGTVGTTKGAALFVSDAGGVARLLLSDKVGRPHSTDIETQSLLQQMVAELQAMNMHLSHMTGLEVVGSDMEID